MSLSKKHFIQMAGMLRYIRTMVKTHKLSGQAAVSACENAFMQLCSAENPNFDRQRFLEASHPPDQTDQTTGEQAHD
jgi:hypothetical protein